MNACSKQNDTKNGDNNNNADQYEDNGEDVMDVQKSHKNGGILLFDISHSTKGYLEGAAPQFRGVVSQFGRTLNVNKYYLYGEQPQTIHDDDFFDVLNNGNFKWAKESNLISMIDFMIGKLNESAEISCLITDGIMSGTNEEITGTEYNIQSREVLRNRLASVITKLDSSYSALIVKYTAPFKGVYFCYNNARCNLNCNRPYYAILIGEWEKIKEVEQNLIAGKMDGKNDSFYKYDDFIMFGDEPSYKKCNFGPMKGISKQNDGSKKFKADNKDSIMFSCKISDLQPYMISEAYFNENFKILKSEYPRDSIIRDDHFVTIPRDKYQLRIDENIQKAIITFANSGTSKIIDTYISRKIIRFELKYSYPAWIGIFSDDNDLEIENKAKKQTQTFNLKYFIEGFRDMNHNKYVIQTEMKF